MMLVRILIISSVFHFHCTGLLFFGFGVCMFTFYSVMPHVMKFSSAVVVNLSLLTADIYTLFFGLYLFHFVVS